MHFAIFDENVASLIDGIAGGKFIPIFKRQDPNAGISASFFIGCSEEDYVAIEMCRGALQCDEGGEIGGEHAFVVDGTPPIHIAVFDYRAKRINGPMRFVGGDHVHMRDE